MPARIKLHPRGSRKRQIEFRGDDSLAFFITDGETMRQWCEEAGLPVFGTDDAVPAELLLGPVG